MGRVTIDELAIMMQKEFSSLHGEIAGVKDDVSNLKDDVSKIKYEVDKINFKLDMFASRSEVDELNDRMGNVEKEIKELKLAS